VSAVPPPTPPPDPTAATSGPERDLEAEGSVGYERVVAFSDGVFAIAITLLVLSIDVPSVSGADLPQAVRDLVPQLVSYFIGFGVIGLFWLQHHRFFELLQRFDRTLLLINLAFLAFISLMPFTTGLFGRYGDQPLALALYAGNVAVASLLDSGMLWTAVRRGLLTPAAQADGACLVRANLYPAIVFAISIPVAYVSTSAAPYIWIGVVVFGPLRRMTRTRRQAQVS